MSKKKKIRINEDIKVPEVRLISETGEQLGVVTIEKALMLAQEAQLDLAEVAPKSTPPVAKILNFGKLKYEEKIIALASKKNKHVV
ncbi:MAG: translation initiation factor IF-3 [Candidatus Neomarinimicrobiota bacterium]